MSATTAQVQVEPSDPPHPRQPAATLSRDPEYWEAMLAKAKDSAGRVTVPKITTAQEFRAFTDPNLKAMFAKEAETVLRTAEPVHETKTELATFDGATITISRFAQAQHLAPLQDGERPRAAVIYIHGGGMIVGTVDVFAPLCSHHVDSMGVQLFAVDYRVAPESPAPGPTEDAFAGLQWVSRNAASMGIDPARLMVYGDSAGGGIAAGVALLARDRQLQPPLAKQILACPMLDDRTRYGEDWAQVRQFLTWSEESNRMGWEAYLGADKAGREDAEVSIYDAPGRAGVEDLKGLPRTYIDVGSLDLFRDEDLRYAAALLEADVEVELHLYPGVPHGFETARTTSVAQRAIENRKRAILAV